MKTNATLPALIAVLVLSVTQVRAESRVWTDNKGTTIEAEHVRTLSDKVVLKKGDGSEMQVSLDTLSERDRRYAILQTPPRIDISVAAKTDRDNKGYSRGYGGGLQVQTETVDVEVTLKKSSSQPYEAPLRAEVYVIGSPEQKDGYAILDKKTTRFNFLAEKDYEHDFSSGTITLKQVESGKQSGVEYKGYLVVVRDKTGDVIAMKCSKLEFEKNAEALLAGEKGTLFDGDFNQLDKSAKTAKPETRRKRPFPGRAF